MSWYCPNCGTKMEEEDKFCASCGTRRPALEKESTSTEKSGGKIALIAVLAVLLGLLLGGGVFFAVSGVSPTDVFNSSGKTSTTVTVTDSTTVTSSQSETQTTVTSTTASTTTTGKSRKTLYLPKDSEYIERHDVEVWSDEIEYDEYINIRYGPSKTDYDVIKKVQNGTMGYGLTGSVNGWVLVEVGGVKGWVRDDLVIHYEDGMPDGIAKPVLYLYPEKKTDVSVKLKLKDAKFSCTYPDYGKGWNVTAYPGGKVVNKADGREYSYLYWELDSTMKFDFSEGFIVKGSDTAVFLQKTLAAIGLQPKEYNEFIVYWLPLMQGNEYNLISFQSAAYTDNVGLKISPKPDSVLRVNMAYKPLSGAEAKKAKATVKAQTFPKFERKGFTVVEWGGEKVK